jgi:hypothetical protein
MNHFEIIGQARLDAAEGQRMMALAAMRWLRKTTVKLIDAIGRYLPESKTAPW